MIYSAGAAIRSVAVATVTDGADVQSASKVVAEAAMQNNVGE
jgi:hypothetical protein